MYVINIQNDVIGLVLREICKSKQMTDCIAWPSRCHDTIYILFTLTELQGDVNIKARGSTILNQYENWSHLSNSKVIRRLQFLYEINYLHEMG